MARKPLKPKRIFAIVPIAQALKRLGYDPIPLWAGKSKPKYQWPTLPNEPEDIARWTGKSVALRMRGCPCLFAIDLDISLEPVLEAVLAAYTARWPAFMGACIRRHSGRVRVMLIGRMVTGRRHMHSGRYGVCDEHKGGHRVELFTSNDSRYIAVWGLHSVEGGVDRNYGYTGRELFDGAEIAGLPEFLDGELGELLSIPDRIMAEMGLVLSEPPGMDVADIKYDLKPDRTCEMQDGRVITLEELCPECVDKFVYVHGRLFDPGSDSFRCKAKMTSSGLTIWDFGTDIEHRWEHLGPQPEVLMPLLKKLAADTAAATAPPMFNQPPPPPPPGQPTALVTGRIAQSDVAMVFAENFDGKMLYCHNTGKWYVWTGAYWKPEETRLAFQYSRELAIAFSEGAKPTEYKEVRRASFAGAVEKFAQGDRRISVTAERWDRDPFLLGTPDGTLDLRTGLLRTADAVDGITRLTAVTPMRGMPTPLWTKFLLETFTGDDCAGLIHFIQQWFGYCLTGDIREHALWFGFGDGGNGKGVLLNTIRGILKDYAVAAAMATFTASKWEQHSTELAMLKGSRIVTASETEKGRAWAESRIKQITGGDPVTARFMRQNFFTFSPEFKLTLIGNHKPLLRGVDDAVRRRFNLVPFMNKPVVVDRQLEARLRPEWPGILAWLVEGCLNWQQNGLIRPVSVTKATEGYFEDQDITGQWLADCCEVRPGTVIAETSMALFSSWKHFAEEAGEYPGNRKAFTTELMRRGFEAFRRGKENTRCIRGIKLNATPLAKAVVAIVPKDLEEKPED